jgi:hypothetical protein
MKPLPKPRLAVLPCVIYGGPGRSEPAAALVGCKQVVRATGAAELSAWWLHQLPAFSKFYSVSASMQVVSLAALAVSRVHVWPLSAMANYLRPEELHIPQSQQFILWWAGLRGAMAFALALQAADDLPGSCALAACCSALASAESGP